MSDNVEDHLIKLIGDDISYTLEDGEEIHQEHPDTFWIPPLSARQNLQPDDLVKLIFRLTDGERVQPERMWVLVTNAEGGRYAGTLDNDPLSTQAISAGMPVKFEARHVINIYGYQTDG